MLKNKTRYRKKILFMMTGFTLLIFLLIGRLAFLMICQSVHYTDQADQLHLRERHIKAKRGRILDCNGDVLADNRMVCTVSVIHSQIKEPEKIITELSRLLGLSEDTIRKRVEKVSSIEKIKSNVDKETGDAIRNLDLAGVKVDEDYKRYYPYGEIASKVLGFTGGDNQGIIGLEVQYDALLQGEKGTILTYTDARGIDLEEKGELRKEPVAGNDLWISIDRNIQMYATQLAKQAMAVKEAKRVSIIVMNPQNGEIFAMVDVPEFDLNAPYSLPEGTAFTDDNEKWNLLNKMWRNGCINDTYEPGSIFKVITASAGLEEQVVTIDDRFYCPGYVMVEDRRIRCHKAGGHGSQSFLEATMHSCNPAFVSVGSKLGAQTFYNDIKKFGILDKTGIDLPGEASAIMHKVENIKPVELATISFGQSFQITPLQLATTVSSLVNGGKRVTPHLGVKATNAAGKTVWKYPKTEKGRIVSEKVSKDLCMMLEQVVENGGGINGYLEGYSIGGKTATSETLPRGQGKYISAFLGFAPADNPQVLAIAIIHEPKGLYYGGTIAAPVIRQLFENILPYLEGMDYNIRGKKEAESENDKTKEQQ